jgi:prefoldin subunit 5
VKGMIDVIEKNKEIQRELENIVSNSEGMKLTVSKVDELLEALPKLEKEDDDGE